MKRVSRYCIVEEGIHLYRFRSFIKGERQIENLNVKFLIRISIWGRLVGVLTVFFGIFNIVQESITPIYDLFTAVFTVIGGYFLFQTGIAAKNILNGKSDESSGADNIFESYGYYLQITGSLFIIVIVALFFIFIIL